MENHDRLYNTLVDVEKLQELHEDYVEQNEKFWSREYWYELVPEYKTAWEVCEYLWDNKVKNVSWVKGTSGYFSAYVYGEPASSEDYQQIYDWVDAFDERQRLQDVAIQKMYPIREKYIEDYVDKTNALYRNYYIALIEAWNVSVQFADLVQTLDSDPYSIENIPRGNATYDAASELGMLGISAAASFAICCACLSRACICCFCAHTTLRTSALNAVASFCALCNRRLSPETSAVARTISRGVGMFFSDT